MFKPTNQYNKLITLDTMGYISDPSLIIDRVFRYFFVANYSQTNVHYGNIKSLPWLIARYPEDYFSLQREIKDALTSMLYGYFDNVEIDCTIAPEMEGLEVKQIITIDFTVYRGGRSWSGGKLLTLIKNRISKIEEV